MPQITANGIRIEYDTFGDPAHRPLLLVMGLGAQMTRWRPEFCELLAADGHYVVRFDNRDVGLSQKFEAAGVPNMAEIFARAQSGQPVTAPYSLDDMADDAVGVLDALGIERAHVCGASMGGMIVQQMAVRHGQRLHTMTRRSSASGHARTSNAASIRSAWRARWRPSRFPATGDRRSPLFARRPW